MTEETKHPTWQETASDTIDKIIFTIAKEMGENDEDAGDMIDALQNVQVTLGKGMA